ncbi:MAG: tail fiber domain-containing protein [Clostridiales bacterium]|nr:tail fiber domain-containing protein [Clostridiales bacterium]
MITTSTEFGEQMGSNARKLCARFLLNGETVEGEVKEVKVNKGACGDSAFSVGNVYSSYITVTIDDCPTLLENQELELQIGVELTDGTVEYCTVGFYTASDVATSVGSTTFTGLGRLSSKCGGGYWSDNGWPQTVQSALDEIAEQIGVSIDASACDSTALALNIETSMDGLLHREALMYIAGLLGGFATESSDGGIIIQPFTNEVTAEIDADRTTEMFEFSDYDFTVTGVEVIVSESGTDDDGNEVEGVSYTYGTPNLTLSNPYMTQALFDIMAPQITGFTYRPGTVPLDMGDIRLEAGDVISAVDAEGVSHTVACLLVEHTFDGGLMTTITAPGESEAEQEAGFTGALAAAVQKTAAELIVTKKVTATSLEAIRASITELTAKAITTDYLTANYITANDIAAKYVATEYLTANYITATDISAKYVTTDTLKADYITATDISAKYVTTDTLTANYITATDIAAKYVTTSTLTANYITASDIKAAYATIDLANVSVESVGTLFADVGLLTSMTVVDGYITGALNGVTISANQLTAGTIDAGTIDVVNLNCANLTVGTINGSQIASGTITATNLSEDITSAITTAQQTADGKNAVYYSDTAPSGGTYAVNDIWYDTANGYAMYYWDGGEWVKAVYGASALSDEVTADIATALEQAGLAKEAVDNLSVGGRNYLPNTRTMDGWLIDKDVITLTTDDEGYTVATWAATDTLGWHCIDGRDPIQFSSLRGQTVTLSLDIRADDYASINASTSRGCIVRLVLCTSDSNTITLYRNIDFRTVTLSDSWQRISRTVTLTDDYFSSGSGSIDDTTRFYIEVFDYSLYSMQVRKVKLEIGTAATDWSPAPEDAETAIDEVITIVNGKTTSYYADTVPSGTDYVTGDIWFDTANDNAMYYWNGEAWTLAPFGTDAIADGAVTANLIAASAVTAGKISSGAVTTDKLAANAVTAAKIKAGTITSEQISAGTITGDNIATSTITAGNLVAGTITSNEIAAGTITASNIASRTITADLIKTGTITGDLIAAETITGDNLVAETITATQIAAATITGDKIAAKTIEAGNLSVTELSAITGDVGELTAGILKSSNYDADAGTGLLIDLDSGTITGSDLTLLATKIDNISVGGRNYLLNTKELTNVAGQTAFDATYFTRTEDGDGFGVLTVTGDGVSRAATFYTAIDASGDAFAERELTFSADVKADDLATAPGHYQLSFSIFGSNDGTSWTRTAAVGYLFSTKIFNTADYVDGAWVRVTANLTGCAASEMTAYSTTDYSQYVYAIQVFSRKENTANTLSIRKPKLETGNVATDWSPAPEDTDDQIEAKLALTVDDEGVAKLSANADRIELTSGQIVIDSDNFSLDADGNVTINGELHTATGVTSTIGGWTVTDEKIYTTGSNGRTVVMRVPSSSDTGGTVFAAGGTSHDDYTDSPFRVNGAGKLYAMDITIGNTLKMYSEDDDKTYTALSTMGGMLSVELPIGASEISCKSFTLDSDSGYFYVQPKASFGSSIECGNHVYAYGHFVDYAASDVSAGMSCYWADEADTDSTHYLIYRDTDGLTAYFGYAGSSTYSTTSVIRGRTVKYQNSSGSTTLSDERIKKDWTSLDAYDAFFDRLKPKAFRYIDGNAGRFHIGLGAQTTEQALLDSGLTAEDFAGLVISPVKADEEGNGYHGFDKEYGLIYTEFVGLLIDQVQKLKDRVSDLETKIEKMEG